MPVGVFLYTLELSHGIRAIRDVTDSWVSSFGIMFIDREVFLAWASEHCTHLPQGKPKQKAGLDLSVRDNRAGDRLCGWRL